MARVIIGWVPIVVNKFGLSDLRLWVTMQNIYIWTKYSGMDPEVTLKTSITDLGKDTSRSGLPHDYSIGFTVSF